MLPLGHRGSPSPHNTESLRVRGKKHFDTLNLKVTTGDEHSLEYKKPLSEIKNCIVSTFVDFLPPILHNKTIYFRYYCICCRAAALLQWLKLPA